MNLDAATVAAIVTLSGIAGGFAKGLGDWIINIIKLRSERKAKERQEQTGDQDKDEQKRDKTVTELWDLLQHVREDSERDRANFEREKAEFGVRVETVEKELRKCHEDHIKSELEHGKALARIEILEYRDRQRVSRQPKSTDTSDTHKPLPPDGPNP